MCYIEIVFKDVNKKCLEKFINECVKIETKNIIDSHFYDSGRNIDIQYKDVNSLEEYFSEFGTCNIYVSQIDIGATLNDVLVLISYDKKGDIILNFKESQFEKKCFAEIKTIIDKLVCRVQEICKICEINKCVIGYEPAEDFDMKIIEITNKKIEKFNEGYFESLVSKAFYLVE